MLAKLTRPRVHRALPRERLFERLDEARERPLLWVVAPPGSGKTTLVASYIDDRKLRSAWYHVDPGDDDLGTFFYYLAQTLPAARGKREVPLPLLTPENRADLPAYCRHFFRLFFARLPTPAALVLDNYHELPPTSQLHAVLEQAAAEVPEGFNIVAISRVEPPKALVRLKLGDRIALIDWSQLRLSLDETRAIARTRGAVDEAVLKRIYRLSDGWAAGIVLTLQRAQQQRDKSGQEHEAREEMFDYFAAQVLGAASPETQRFLRITALLPTMTGEMADRLLEAAAGSGEAQLEQAYLRGAFIDRRNTRPPIYHYHDLFRAFLLAQLEQSLPADEFTALQRRAAVVLSESGHQDHAVRLYLKLGDWPAAGALIVSLASGLVAQGRGHSLQDWISAIPAAIVAHNPWLIYWYGAPMARSRPAEARGHFERAYELFRERGDVLGQRLLCAEVILAFMHEFANVTPLDRWIAEMQRLVADPHPFPNLTMELHVRTALLYALGFRQPDTQAVRESMARVGELIGAEVPLELAAVACGILIMQQYMFAHRQAYGPVAARLRAMLDAPDLSPVGRALGWMQYAHATLRFGSSSEAVPLFERAVAIGKEHAVPLPTLYVFSNLGMALCALEAGDVATAEECRRQIEHLSVPSRKIDGVATSRVQLWIACRRRQWDAALPLARQQLERARECGALMLIYESHLLLAMVCAEAGESGECGAALAPVPELIGHTAFAHFVYLIDLVRAYEALLRGDRAACHEYLRRGLAGSRTDDAKFMLRMQPFMLPRLAAEALAADIDAGYVTQLIAEHKVRAPSITAAHWPWPLRIHTLGRFAVLRAGQPLEFSRKAPKKTLALLKAIIAGGGRNVREQLLLDAFWSDEEGDVAERSLTAALHRLRALLGDNDAVVQQGGTLSLDASRVWVDVWAFDELAAQGQTGGEALLELYRGGFLVEDEGEPWSVTMRERLRGKFIHTLALETRALEAVGNFELAIECYLRGLDADPVIEQFYQGLMRCYARLDRRSEAIAAYRRLKQMLSVSLSLKPSTSTEKLYQALRLE